MVSQIYFAGPVEYRLRSAADAGRAIAQASAHRILHGPKRPGWNWYMETGTEILKKQVTSALTCGSVTDARKYLDAMLIHFPALAEVNITPMTEEKFRGTWFLGHHGPSSTTLLYLHGGGYSFYPRAYAGFIAQITLAAKSRTFALDYRLAPEHRFPAQLDDAVHAYRWLLQGNVDPCHLVVAGDSAGANLTLALLLKLRELALPLPALAVVLSPPTNFESEAIGSDDFDWISKPALLQWRDWFCDGAQRRDPLVSPLRADLRGLPLIYVQAGRCEVLYDSIRAFADRADSQGADLILESWEDMNHVFQIFGPEVPQSVEALKRIGDVISRRTLPRERKEPVPCGTEK